jgi:hypothetical protein
MNNHAKGFDPGLGRVFNFDAADLDANRAGRLSEQQELILRNTVRVLGAPRVASPRDGRGTDPPLGRCDRHLGGVRKGRRHTEAVTNARVHLAEGEVRVEPAYSGEHYWAHIGQVRFGIDTDQWDELDDDARYRLHYFPIDGDAALLSLERVLEHGNPLSRRRVVGSPGDPLVLAWTVERPETRGGMTHTHPLGW